MLAPVGKKPSLVLSRRALLSGPLGARSDAGIPQHGRRILGRGEGSVLSEWQDYITTDPEVLRGKPRLKGTRIPVGLVLGYLAAGKTAADILHEFPDLTPEQIAACLNFARDLCEFEVTA